MIELDSQVNDDAARAEQLHALGLTLAGKRSEAIQARSESGIEQEWAEDLDHYDGIDDANRKESSAWRTKPPGQIQTEATSSTRSTVFINITAPYCDTAAASMADMLLPTDDRGWSLLPTPIPDLAALARGKVPRAMQLAVAQMFPPNLQLQAAPPAQPAQPPGMLSRVAGAVRGALGGQQPAQPAAPQQDPAQAWIQQQIAKAQEMVDAAKATAEKAQKRIEDWHVESQFHREVRDMVDESARVGTGVLKGPVPLKMRGVMFADGALTIEEKIQPGSKCISVWNLFPDGACGDDIHSGSHVFERDEIGDRELLDLIGMPGYIESAIRECVKEGPTKAISNPKRDQGFTETKKGKFEIWYFHGYLSKDDLASAGCDCEKEMEDLPAVITMVNNRVIRASLNPLDSGDFPYDVMPWSKRAGHWAGRGVSRQIRTAQKMVNAGWRALMDNAGIASGPMLVFRQGVVTPHDGVAELRPRKVWTLAEDADATIAAERAIGVIKVDMMVNELLLIIKEAMSLAEIVSGLPMLLQGQQGRAPETLGGMQLLNNNSSVVRRRIARLFDDYVTEPHVRRYYRWLLQHGDDDSEKGEFIIDARGSSALVQRDIENQSIGEMANMVMNRAFKVDPARWFAEWCKSRHLDPKRLQYTDEEFAQLPAPAPDPIVQAAMIRAKMGDADNQTALKQTQAELTVEQQEKEKDRQLEMLTLHSNEYIQQMKQQGATAETVAALKGMLAATSMKLTTQTRLAAMDAAQRDDHTVAKHMVDLHKNATTPPVQVPGRAPNGKAFEQV